MSLYDDLEETDKKTESNVAGWASGIKFLQSHMQLKKAAITQPKRDLTRKNVSTLAPVIDLNFKANNKANNININESEQESKIATPFSLPYSVILPKETKKKKGSNRIISTYLAVDPEWQFENEYDPVYPNDYDKAVKELRERRDREAEEEEARRRTDDDRERDEDRPRGRSDRSGGAQIAPPPSLSQPSSSFSDVITKAESSMPSSGGGGLTAAARIMAKYGYKEGQGLGKKEQGMSMALQVQKTSHRIGRIIHEKDIQKEVTLPNPFGLASSMAAYIDDEDEVQMDEGNPIVSTTTEEPALTEEKDNEQTIADILKHPSKILLLKNMVGPGEVDDELEPEVKEECSKYGEVGNVTVFQMPEMDADDAIRIFVEFRTVDASVKGFMDLNGRFFGGRQVKASFYDTEKYNNLELTD